MFSFQYTETCPECASKGIDNKLRYYYISLDEAIYKCAGAKCLYPFDKFIFKNLKDNSVYYYEEVFDGGELMFRVSLEGKGGYQSTNPLSTELSCDSQRNPDIESYNDYDFSDLFNAFETEAKPQPDFKSNGENPDFSEFCDETAMTSKVDTDKMLDENGIDNMITNLSNVKKETSIEKLPSGKLAKSAGKVAKSAGKNKIKTEAKLTKCIQHIEKAKNSKKKANEKPPNTFMMAVRKARKSQSTGKNDLLPVKMESKPIKEESMQIPLKKEIPKIEKSKQSNSKSTLSNDLLNLALKDTSKMRPTELAKKLNSMDLSSIKFNKEEKKKPKILKNILKDWSDSECEQSDNHENNKFQKGSNKQIDEYSAVDDTESVISISSGTSDSCVAVFN